MFIKAGFVSRKMLLLLVMMTIYVVSSKAEYKEKNYLTISGKIANNQQDSLTFFTFHRKAKTIKINSDGTFSDTLHIKKPTGLYLNYNHKQHAFFVRNGYDLHLTWDGSEESTDGFLLFRTLKFSGYGSDIVTYYNDDRMDYTDGGYYNDDRFKLSVKDFLKRADDHFDGKLDKAPKTDPYFTAYYAVELHDSKRMDCEAYEKNQYIFTVLKKGSVSPKFTNYEDVNGNKVSLDDFKGKYVFIDLWATWCAPCMIQIPHLKELEEEYKGRNIEFIGISVDNQKTKEKWKAVVAAKHLTNVQLITDNESASEFTKAYQVESIPRFILIDPEGKIVSANAPAPSHKEEIKALFDEMGI